jgi:hypothetical protein
MFESLRGVLIELRKSETARCEPLTTRERAVALMYIIRCCQIIRLLQELAARN